MARNKKKLLRDFIDEIPDSKLQGLPNSQTTLYRDQNFRLDMQGMTSSGQWNLQIQVNNRPKASSLREYAPDTVSGPVLVSPDSPMDAEAIREGFRNTCLF
ncbi:hypothetical protein B0I35DRAFT_443806 [Stachybotrys elegans]|uniref:Uncharacterized protein n=1 Tax=Stachybotrys elegans TaxID=80388 RepID=A0A8K0WK87_9HYPO|nr:hypothetical protein B0I35DRAFT_443806 [Stachybotrys elegans]